MIAGRLPVRATPEQATWHYCDEHAALIGLRGRCPGPAFDLGLAERSVTIQAAYAFGDWPPRSPLTLTELAAWALRDPLWARYLDGDR